MRILALAAALVWIGCAAGNPPGAFGATELLEREVDFGAPQLLEDPDGAYRAQVALPFEFGRTDAGTDRIHVELGGEIPMDCLLFESETQLGATVARNAKGLFDVIAQHYGAVARKKITGIQAGQVAGAAYHGMTWVFLLADGALGELKVVSANHLGRGFACHHWGAGYRASFLRVFRELLETFEVNAPAPEPYFAEVQVVRSGGLPIGIESLRFVRDDEGDTRVDLQSSMLAPTAADEVSATYSRSVEWADPDGRLINAFAREVDVDEETANLALRWSEERGWHVTGTFQGKELDAEIDRDVVIDSVVREYLALARDLAPKGPETAVRLQRWISDARPTAPTAFEYRTDPERPERVEARLGSMRFAGRRDETGLIESGTVSVGRLELEIESIFRAGLP